jgi:hypothetical protein
MRADGHEEELHSFTLESEGPVEVFMVRGKAGLPESPALSTDQSDVPWM